MSSSAINIIKRRSSLATKKLDELTSEISNLVEASEKIAEDLEFAKEKLAVASYPGLNFTSIRDALCDMANSANQEWIPKILATTGSGPWDIEEFDQFLQKRSLEIFHMPNRDINGLIVGTSGWSEEDLSEQIYNRSPNSLRIYTQELFVLGMIVGRDPYDFLEQQAVDDVGFNHPAIQFILNQEFSWPWSDLHLDDQVQDEDWDIDGTDWANESVLKQMGYNASASGPNEFERRRILRRVFESETLPGIESQEQRQRWGSKRSSRRLHSISHFLGWLINLQGSEKPAAKEKWSSDLKWLKKEFYAKTMRFTWPTITSPSFQTVLNPETAWPFATNKQSSSRVTKTTSNDYRNHLKPRHALAVMIGDEPQPSVESALTALREYISENKLIKPGSSLIQADDHLFSLAGQMYIKDSDLYEIVQKHLSA